MNSIFSWLIGRTFAKKSACDKYHVIVKRVPTPNYAVGLGREIDTIVLHNTAGPLSPSLQRLQDPKAQVSTHYVIDRDGTVYQMVDDKNVAWHAGNRAVNLRSIGIEIVAYQRVHKLPDALGLSPEQETALTALVKSLAQKYQIRRENIVPHRRVRATECPSLVWKTDAELEAWKASKEF